MQTLKLLLDMNIVIDFLNRREPFYDQTRLLMACGKLGEVSLWMSASRMTDVVYILSDGGNAQLVPSALQRLQKLRTFVNVANVGPCETDLMLSTTWDDPEDALLAAVANAVGADAIITRNQSDFARAGLPVFDCGEFFDWLQREQGISYEEVAL